MPVLVVVGVSSVACQALSVVLTLLCRRRQHPCHGGSGGTSRAGRRQRRAQAHQPPGTGGVALSAAACAQPSEGRWLGTQQRSHAELLTGWRAACAAAGSSMPAVESHGCACQSCRSAPVRFTLSHRVLPPCRWTGIPGARRRLRGRGATTNPSFCLWATGGKLAGCRLAGVCWLGPEGWSALLKHATRVCDALVTGDQSPLPHWMQHVPLVPRDGAGEL